MARLTQQGEAKPLSWGKEWLRSTYSGPARVFPAPLTRITRPILFIPLSIGSGRASTQCRRRYRGRGGSQPGQKERRSYTSSVQRLSPFRNSSFQHHRRYSAVRHALSCPRRTPSLPARSAALRRGRKWRAAPLSAARPPGRGQLRSARIPSRPASRATRAATTGGPRGAWPRGSGRIGRPAPSGCCRSRDGPG